MRDLLLRFRLKVNPEALQMAAEVAGDMLADHPRTSPDAAEHHRTLADAAEHDRTPANAGEAS